LPLTLAAARWHVNSAPAAWLDRRLSAAPGAGVLTPRHDGERMKTFARTCQ